MNSNRSIIIIISISDLGVSSNLTGSPLGRGFEQQPLFEMASFSNNI